MTGKEEYFKLKKTWEKYDEGEIIKQYKIPFVMNKIPNNVKTILDVGCGNGIITNVLSKEYDVTGIDFSAIALEYVECNSICCSADNIPVKDNSFDMIFSSQLLEHLSNPVLDKTILELKRIAKKYIIITLPHNELLERNYVKCPICGNIFNNNGHLQSFSFEKFQHFFGDEYKMIDSDIFGVKQRQYNKTLLKVRQNFGDRFFIPSSYTLCEKCGNTDFPTVKGNMISKLCNGLNLLISRKKPYWMIMVFKKKTYPIS